MAAFADHRAAGGEVGLGKGKVLAVCLHTSTSPLAPLLIVPRAGRKISPTVPVWSRDPRRAPSRRRTVPLPPWGAAQAAGLRGLHGSLLRAGLPHLADKALGLALRGAPVGIALAVILVDPEHPREHVHTRVPDGAQEGVMIPAS